MPFRLAPQAISDIQERFSDYITRILHLFSYKAIFRINQYYGRGLVPVPISTPECDSKWIDLTTH